jgi:hypothetical protein
MLTTPASLPIASPQPSAPALEQVIGEVTANAALAIVRALRHQNNGLSPRNAASVFGDRVAQLFELQQAYTGRLDFCAAVRIRGAHALQERYGKDINARTIAVLIDAVLEVLRHVVSRELN